jgi:phage shock protein C
MVEASRRLTRRPEQGKLGGVCEGLAEYMDVDVTLVRLAWVCLSIVPGVIVGGLLAYAAAWLIIPEADGPAVAATGRRLKRSRTNRMIAGVCGGVADYFNTDPTVVRLLLVVLSIWPGAIIMGVLFYLLAWLVMPDGDALPGAQTVHA